MTFQCFLMHIRQHRKTAVIQLHLIAYTAAQKNGGYTIAFNAANEVAVEAFTQNKIGFTDIQRVTQKTLEKDFTKTPESFEDVLEIDRTARRFAEEVL